RVEILRLVQSRYRYLEPVLIVDIAFVEQKLAPHYAVPGECISRKFQLPKRKLFTFGDTDRDVDDSLIRICRTVLEFRQDLGVVLNKALRAVSFFEVFVDRVLQAFSIRDLTF